MLKFGSIDKIGYFCTENNNIECKIIKDIAYRKYLLNINE